MYANRLVCESTCMRNDRKPWKFLKREFLAENFFKVGGMETFQIFLRFSWWLQSRLNITFHNVKQILTFLLYVISKQTCWINLIITFKTPLGAATSKGF